MMILFDEKRYLFDILFFFLSFYFSIYFFFVFMLFSFSLFCDGCARIENKHKMMAVHDLGPNARFTLLQYHCWWFFVLFSSSLFSLLLSCVVNCCYLAIVTSTNIGSPSLYVDVINYDFGFYSKHYFIYYARRIAWIWFVKRGRWFRKSLLGIIKWIRPMENYYDLFLLSRIVIRFWWNLLWELPNTGRIADNKEKGFNADSTLSNIWKRNIIYVNIC